MGHVSAEAMPGVVAVVGSVNLDHVVRTERAAGAGETVTARSYLRAPGGKGLNQAVAAARAGARVEFVAAVGADPTGDEVLALATREGVGSTWVRRTSDAPTGAAFVRVGDDGENAIVVVPGANALLAPADVTRASELLAAADVVLAQLEVPLDAVAAAATHTRARFVLNAAPVAAVPAELLARADPLVVNEHEALALLPPSARAARSASAAQLAAALVAHLSVRSCVVTAGAAGLAVAVGGEVVALPAYPVAPADVVDTTGAGDVLAGYLAAGLAGGATLPAAAAEAAVAAALSVLRLGAVDSAPRRTDLPGHIPAPR
jgi:ribokinase